MKVKVFTNKSGYYLENEINTWFDSQMTEMELYDVTQSASAEGLTFTIWYQETATYMRLGESLI